jgi:hypothetical protein
MAQMITRWQQLKQNLSSSSGGRAFCFVFLIVVLFAVGVVLSNRSLNYPWYGDDFHLVRNFSGSEITQALRGNWDKDGIETPGYRPLTVAFNALRTRMFNESVVSHRLFQIALLAAYLAVASIVAINLGLSYWAAMFAAVFTICTKNNWWNLVWIVDGVHALTGLLLMLAVLLSISAVGNFAAWKIVLAAVLPTLALLVREDALSMFPMIPITGFIYACLTNPVPPARLRLNNGRVAWDVARQDPRFPSLCLMIILSLLLLVAALIFFYVRSRLVAGAPFTIVWEGWQMHLVWLLYPMGITLHGVTPEAVYLTWLATFGFLSGVNLFIAPARWRFMTIYWLVSILVTSAHGLVEARGNLLLIPSTFLSFGIVWMMGGLAKLSRPAFTFSVLVVLSVLISSAIHNRIAQEAANPLSTDYLQSNSNFLWGGKYSQSTVPPVRLAELQQLFVRLNINSRSDFDSLFPGMVEEAATRHSPSDADGKPFEPRISFLQP